MAAAAGGSSSKHGAAAAAELPTDAAAIRNILKTMGVEMHEPRVTNMLLDFMYSYVSGVLSDASAFAEQASVCLLVAVVGDCFRARILLCVTAYITVPAHRRWLLLSFHWQRACSMLNLSGPDLACPASTASSHRTRGLQEGRTAQGYHL